MDTSFELSGPRIGEFCRRWRIAELAVFGSAARGELRADSDIDFLVSWEPDTHWSLHERGRIEEELAEIVGRPIDLVSKKAVEESDNFVIRRHILASATTVYAA